MEHVGLTPKASKTKNEGTSLLSDIEVAIAKPTPVQLVFQSVSISVPTTNPEGEKLLLDNVTASFGPNELAAVMGPSGSGKTTLMNAIIGKGVVTSGTVTVNGEPFDADVAKNFTALVPQDDLLFTILTPYETLMDQAIYRTNLSKEAAKKRVKAFLKQFDLMGCKDVMVGNASAGRKGISGGQKKRLSVAMELMSNPSLLFLDEPTSGLDAVSALALLRLLKSISESDATIVLTIHQPSLRIFGILDSLLLLVGGKMAYAGPVNQPELLAFFADSGFHAPPQSNPADFIMEVVTESEENVQILHKRTMARLETTRKLRGAAYIAPLPTELQRHSEWKVFKTLLLRATRILLRNPAMSRVQVGSPLVIGIVVGVLFRNLGNNEEDMESIITLLLFCVIFELLLGVLPTLVAVLPEIAIVNKEYRNNYYSIRPYYAAKMLVELPFLLIPPACFTLVVGSITGITANNQGVPNSTLTMDMETTSMVYASFAVIVITSAGWGNFLCCVAPDFPSAVVLAPLSVMPLILFSGIFKNRSEIPDVFRWISYIDYVTYGWEFICYAIFKKKRFVARVGDITLTGDWVLNHRFEFDDPKPTEHGAWLCFSIACGFLVLSYLIAFAAFRWKLAR